MNSSEKNSNKFSSDLVSIIIPCYNQEKWVSESIESALSQTYKNKEIIVVDDGSTDGSLEIIKRYKDWIMIVESKHQNGNFARNLGFEKSKGFYVQFLDADDYILPEKISTQVKIMQAENYDVVYGDWRHLYCDKDGSKCYGEVKISGEKEDYIHALVSGWWVSPASLLVKRKWIESILGWDTEFEIGQDRDFFLSLAIAGAKIHYRSDCHTIYRRYGAVTVSTKNQATWVKSHIRVLEKAETKLKECNQFSEIHKNAFAEGYFKLARICYEMDKDTWKRLDRKINDLNAHFSPKETFLYNFLYKMFGSRCAEFCAVFKRRILHV